MKGTLPGGAALDLGVGVSLLYASAWVYEVGNLAALALVGASPSLLLGGLLPLGVASGASPWAPALAKPLQVGIGIGVFLMLRRGLRDWNAPVTKSAIVAIVAAYASSWSWEMLGTFSTLPAWAHFAAFAVPCCALAGALAMRPLRAAGGRP